MKIHKNYVLLMCRPPWGPPRKNTSNPRPKALTQGLRYTLSEREK